MAQLPDRKNEVALPTGKNPKDYITGADYNALMDAVLDESGALAASAAAAAGSAGEAQAAVASIQGGEYPYVVAGASTARKDKDRWADVVNARDFGAKGDGVTDDTAAVAAAYAALGTVGGTIQFPPGNYKFNMTVTKNGVYLRGAGSSYATGAETGTRFRPWNPAIPLVQFGDGTSTIYFGGITGVAAFGDGLNATGDGLFIYGAFFLDFDDTAWHVFGRDNIRITSSATAATSFIHFRKLATRGALGSSFKAEYGGSYTTAVFINDASIMDATSTGARALWLDGVNLTATGSYLDVHDGHGVYFTGTAPRPRLIMNGVNIDAGDLNAVIVEVNNAPTTISDYLIGQGRVQGKVKWNDASLSATLYAGTDFNVYSRIFSPFIGGTIALGDVNGLPIEGYGGTPAVTISRFGAAGLEAVALSGAAFRPDATYLRPIQPSSNGAIWRNGTTGQLRYAPLTRQPASDATGVPISPVRVDPGYGVNIAIDASAGTEYVITPTNGTAFTILNPGFSAVAQRITVRIVNTFGVLGAVTWSANYKLAAWTQPANGFSRAIDFQYNGSVWVEVSRTPSDVPN